MNKQTVLTSHKHKRTKEYSNLICAVLVISESEIAKVIPDYDYRMSEKADFINLLRDLGMDTSRTVLRQDGLQHRNRFGEVVVCSRWVGNERVDDAWINSGYASQQALDKAQGSKILEDIYRSKSLTEDTQNRLTAKDTRIEAAEVALEETTEVFDAETMLELQGDQQLIREINEIGNYRVEPGSVSKRKRA